MDDTSRVILQPGRTSTVLCGECRAYKLGRQRCHGHSPQWRRSSRGDTSSYHWVPASKSSPRKKNTPSHTKALCALLRINYVVTGWIPRGGGSHPCLLWNNPLSHGCSQNLKNSVPCSYRRLTVLPRRSVCPRVLSGEWESGTFRAHSLALFEVIPPTHGCCCCRQCLFL